MRWVLAALVATVLPMAGLDLARGDAAFGWTGVGLGLLALLLTVGLSFYDGYWAGVDQGAAQARVAQLPDEAPP